MAKEATNSVIGSTTQAVINEANKKLAALIAGGGSGKVDAQGNLTIYRQAAPTTQASMFGTVPKSVLWAGGIGVGLFAILLVANQAKKLIKA